MVGSFNVLNGPAGSDGHWSGWMTSGLDVRMVSRVDRLVRVAVSGVLDLVTSDALFDVLTGALTDGDTEHLEIDLGGLTLLDASGVGVLLAVRNRALRFGKTIRVCGAIGLPLQVLEITGVLGLLNAKTPIARRDESGIPDIR